VCVGSKGFFGEYWIRHAICAEPACVTRTSGLSGSIVTSNFHPKCLQDAWGRKAARC
jgi:hypothetical protein